MSKIRWGVIGAGGIARRRTIPEGILPADNAVLTAVYDIKDCARIAEEFRVAACASESELLGRSDVDAVYIATPVLHHLRQVELAAKAGKHVLCEKPLGLNPQQAERAEEVCERAGVRLGVGLLMRFHASHCAARALVQQGAIGRPVLGRAQLSCSYPPIPGAWRQDPAQGGGGSLMDMGCHCIDLLEMMFGPARRVYCTTAQLVHSYSVEDSAVVLLDFENGAKGIVDCLFNVPDQAVLNRLELYGSAGSILAEGTIGQSGGGTMTFRGTASRAAAYDADQARAANDGATSISPDPVSPYRAQIEAFSAAVLAGTMPPVDGRAGLWNQRVVAACYESARTGRAVALAE